MHRTLFTFYVKMQCHGIRSPQKTRYCDIYSFSSNNWRLDAIKLLNRQNTTTSKNQLNSNSVEL